MLDGLEEVMTKILLVILIICFGYIFSRIIEYIFYNKHNKHNKYKKHKEDNKNDDKWISE